MEPDPATFTRLACDAQSPNQQRRGQAVQDLLQWCQRDPSIGPSALPIFKSMASDWRDAWSCRCAVRGIELIEGPAAAGAVRLKLLNDSRAQVVTAAALEISDPEMTPVLIQVLTRWPEPRVRLTIIAVLGRLHHPDALAVLAGELNDPRTRPHTVEALKELGDPRAVGYLEPYRGDRSPAWPVDNHGPMLHVSDLVSEAIARLTGIKQPSASFADRAPIQPSSGIQSAPVTGGAGSPRSAGGLALICILVGLLSILANLYGLALAQGAYEFSTHPSSAGGPAAAPAGSTSAALDANSANQVAQTANQTSGRRFTPAEVAAIASQLGKDSIGLARAHDGSAVIAAFINSEGNAVVTFDTARTLVVAPSGEVLTTFSPTLPGQGVKVSTALILGEALVSVALLGLGALLAILGLALLRGFRGGRRWLWRYALLKLPLAILAGVLVAALNYQTDAGVILGVGGVMQRVIIQAIVLIAVGTAFPAGLFIFLKTGIAGRMLEGNGRS